jgi:catalase (peroxidase I)
MHFYTNTPRIRLFRALRAAEESRSGNSPVTQVSFMQERRARQILQALVQGVDPFDGEELPAGTVLQQADVLRALLAGVAALEQDAARASRRAQLPRNIGRTWSAQEQAELIEAFDAGDPLADIAEKHGRTLRAIEARLEKIGLITAAERTTADRFSSVKSESESSEGDPEESLEESSAGS